MLFRCCALITCLTLANVAFAQEESEVPPSPDEKIEPLLKPGTDTRPADEKASSVKFEVESGLDLGTDENGRVIVESVKPKGDAANAGVKEGDILVEIDEVPITSAVNLSKYLTAQQDVQAHFLKLRRGEKDFEVTLGKKVELLGMTIFTDKSQRPLVRRVEKGSSADRAGLRRGDLISGISGRSVETMNQFSEFAIPLIRKMSEGQEIPLRVVRDGDTMDVAVIRPEDAALPLIPAPKETPTPRPQVIKEGTHRHTIVPVQVDDDDDNQYLGGLSGMPAGGGDSLALDFSNNGFSGPLQPFGEVSAVAASLHHVSSDNIPSATAGNMGATGVGAHIGSAGFVLVQSAGTQAIVNARLAGFAPGRYSLAVFEFGDCGDVANGSAGQAALVLGTFNVNENGRATFQTGANNLSAKALLGRVVAVTQTRAGNATPANPQQQLDQNIRRGNPRTVPRGLRGQQRLNPDGGQASIDPEARIAAVSDARSTVELAQVSKNPTAGEVNPQPGRGGKIPFGDDVPPTRPDVNPNNPNVPGSPNNPDQPAAPTDPNDGVLPRNAETIRDRRVNRGARQACGVFGFANPQRPILPLNSPDGGHPVNDAINNDINTLGNPAVPKDNRPNSPVRNGDGTIP